MRSFAELVRPRIRGMDHFACLSNEADGQEYFFAPDAGFNSSPGAGWGRWSPEYDWQDDFTPPPMVKVVPGQKTYADYNLPDLRHTDPGLRVPAPPVLQAQPDLDSALNQVADAVGVSPDKPYRFVDTPADQVLIRYDDLEHVIEKREHARERYANYLLPTLEDPLEVWITQYDDGQFRRRYLGGYTGGKNDALVIAQVEQDGSIFWNLIPMDRREINKQRVGALLWQRKK